MPPASRAPAAAPEPEKTPEVKTEAGGQPVQPPTPPVDDKKPGLHEQKPLPFDPDRTSGFMTCDPGVVRNAYQSNRSLTPQERKTAFDEAIVSIASGTKLLTDAGIGGAEAGKLALELYSRMFM